MVFATLRFSTFALFTLLRLRAARRPPHAQQRDRRRKNHERCHQPAEQGHTGHVNVPRPRQKCNKSKNENGNEIPPIAVRQVKKTGHVWFSPFSQGFGLRSTKYRTPSGRETSRRARPEERAILPQPKKENECDGDATANHSGALFHFAPAGPCRRGDGSRRRPERLVGNRGTSCRSRRA